MRQIYCFAISAKRYTLFMIDAAGEPQLLRKDVNSKSDGWSEHGLGHLLNPTDPESTDRSWIGQAWLYLLREALGRPTPEPPWLDRPALTRTSVSSPAVLAPFAGYNAGKPFASQVKPFNFLLSAHVAPEGHPIGADPEHFHLIAPYELNARKWDRLVWADRYTGKAWRASTLINRGTATTARLKTYRDVLAQFRVPPRGEECGFRWPPLRPGDDRPPAAPAHFRQLPNPRWQRI